MIINVPVPQWDWLQRLLARIYPDVVERCNRFGRARQNTRLLGGMIDITVEAERND